MVFELKRDAPISDEVRRITLQQLEAAIAELHAAGDPKSDAAIHDARRRVKKIRAIIRLVRPVLDKAYREVDTDLRNVSRLLAPVADGQGIIETLDELAHRYGKMLPKRTMGAIRAELIRSEARADRDANVSGVIEIAASTLRGERRRVKHWRIAAHGFHAVGPGLEDTYRRARRMTTLALSEPTPHHFHTWRRCVKEHWFHVRLLEGQCRHHLVAYERNIEALDGVLGEYHNLVLLREVLVDDGALSREEAALVLRIVARYRRLLRRQARTLGTRLYAERPRRYIRRVRQLWKTGGSTDGHAGHAAAHHHGGHPF